jgi:hypothetical protein
MRAQRLLLPRFTNAANRDRMLGVMAGPEWTAALVLRALRLALTSQPTLLRFVLGRPA